MKAVENPPAIEPSWGGGGNITGVILDSEATERFETWGGSHRAHLYSYFPSLVSSAGYAGPNAGESANP